MNLKNIFIASFLLFIPFLTISASTFPEEDAGISAYVKLGDINSEILTEIHSVLLEDEKDAGVNHVLGKTEIKLTTKNPEGDSAHLSSVYPYIYADSDGWLVAYFPKNDPSSKIMLWNDYDPELELSTNVLEEAIDQVIELVNENDEFNLSYSGDPDYYHFEYENANRMTLIVDTVHMEELDENMTTVNNFSVAIPGVIRETSYSLYYSDSYSGSGSVGGVQYCTIQLDAGSDTIKEEECFCCNFPTNPFIYDFYPENTFVSGTPKSVVIKGTQPAGQKAMRMGAATVLIYEVGVE